MSHWPPDYCFEQLKKQREVIAAAASRNEADTRLRAIDTMLFDVLGWDKLDVDVEKYCRAIGFADYACHIDAAPALILEAKRADAAFVVPDVKLPPKAVSFGLLAKECPAADEALRQAIGYAASIGVRYVAISNGHQWLITLPYVQNQRVEERNVVVFESLDAIESKFRLFWECFGPHGVESNLALPLLLDVRKAPPPQKLSQRISVYPAPTTRNAVADTLETVLGAVWEEVKQDEDEVEFLKHCYVLPEANPSTLALAKEIIEQKVSSDERVFAKALQQNAIKDLLKNYSPEKPIVILGDIGHGKTTFLKYLRKIEAATALDRYIQLDIDFVDRPAHADEVSQFIYSRIEDQLRQAPYSLDIMDDALIRAALHPDLNRFKKTPEAKLHPPDSSEYKVAELAFINSIRNDKHEFFKRLFIHLRGSRKFSLAIFMDNLDRRDEPIQEEAYLRASAIATTGQASYLFACAQ